MKQVLIQILSRKQQNSAKLQRITEIQSNVNLPALIKIKIEDYSFCLVPQISYINSWTSKEQPQIDSNLLLSVPDPVNETIPLAPAKQQPSHSSTCSCLALCSRLYSAFYNAVACFTFSVDPS